jgi:hypothetical protein
VKHLPVFHHSFLSLLSTPKPKPSLKPIHNTPPSTIMLRRPNHLLALLTAYVSNAASGSTHSVKPSSAFAFAPAQFFSTQFNYGRHFLLASKTPLTIEEINAESEQLRQEIQELRAEALRRVEALTQSLNLPSTSPTSSAAGAEESKLLVLDATDEEGMMPAPPPIVIKKSEGSKVRKSVASLLDETCWKVSLSIGREPGEKFI